jgi:hypothetical protein
MPSTRLDEDLLERVTLVAEFGWDDSGFWAWSSGEQMCVAMICEYASRSATRTTRPGCDGRQILRELGYSVEQAEQLCAGHFFNGNVYTASRWLESLADRAEVLA